MEDLVKIHDRLLALGEDWADKRSASELLKETSGSVKSQIALEYMGKAKSVAQAKMMAEADGKFIAHIRAMVEAEREANIAKVRYDTAKTYSDLMRTREATRRTEIQTFKG